MSIRQSAALAALEECGAQIFPASLCPLDGGWLALAATQAGKRLAIVSSGETSLGRLLKETEMKKIGAAQVVLAQLNANNAAAVRRFVKWTAPGACGTRGTSVGFCDWLGCGADAELARLFAKRQLKPVLADYAPQDSARCGRNFLAAVDGATWGVLEAGYREGYGANAAGLASEEEIVKALLYGYSMIGFDASAKVHLEIEKLGDEEIEERFRQFNEAFRTAVDASYLDVEFQAGRHKLSYTRGQLHRLVLEFGEAIMHVQFIYNSYLKNTPWDIDFELTLAKGARPLTPHEHYFVANELERNGIKLAAFELDALACGKEPGELEMHAGVAAAFAYRLSLRNADLAIKDPAAVMKCTRGRVHFKLDNVLWLSALELARREDAPLCARLAAGSAEGEAAPSRPPETLGAELAAELGDFLAAQREEYLALVRARTEEFLDKL